MYPQPLMLSPGNAFYLPVTFRPLENVIYEDSIEFATSVRVQLVVSADF